MDKKIKKYIQRLRDEGIDEVPLDHLLQLSNTYWYRQNQNYAATD